MYIFTEIVILGTVSEVFHLETA